MPDPTEQPEYINVDKTVGIIGGLGPAATFDFCQRIVRLTQVGAEQDHLQLLIDNNPKAPDRNRAIAGKGPSPAGSFATSAARLASAGADFLVMPCNTAHAFAPAIADAVQIPFVSMVDATIDGLGARAPSGSAVGVLAVNGCLEARLYQDRLSAAGYTPVLLAESDQIRMMETVYAIKQQGVNAGNRQTMIALARELQDNGVATIIAGCTEVPLVLEQKDIDIPLIDTTELLASLVVEYGKNRMPLPLTSTG